MDTFAVERAFHEYEKEADVVIRPNFYWGASSRAVAPCEGRWSISVKASKEIGDNGARMILDHFRRIFGR